MDADQLTRKEAKPLTYHVQVTDGAGKVLRQCGHHHATADDASRCLRTTCSFDDGSLKPNWQGAEVRHADGSPVVSPEKPLRTHDTAGGEVFPSPGRPLRFFRPRSPRG